MKAVTTTSRKVYDARWAAFRSWCKQQKPKVKHPTRANQVVVTRFLNEKAKTVSFNTIKGYITALSRQHRGIDYGGQCHPLSSVYSIKTWLKGLQNSTTTTRSRTPKWCLELVLKTLTKPPYYPLDKNKTGWRKFLTRRTVFLTAVTSARRTSELHAIDYDVDFTGVDVRLWPDSDFKPKVNTAWHRNRPIIVPAMFENVDPYLQKLCVHRALNDYLNETLTFRAGNGTSQLFLCYGGKCLGEPASKKTISRWLVDTINDAYVRHKLEKPLKVTGHQVRGQAASWGVQAGLDPQTICEAATWSSKSTFVKAYSLKVAYKNRSIFGRRVLSAPVAKARDAAAERRQPTVHRDQRAASRRAAGITPGYVIPRVSRR